MNLKDLIGKDKKVRFVYFRDNELWYECDNGFRFPIPLFDTTGATFLPEDKSTLFIRWITRQLKVVKETEDAKI